MFFRRISTMVAAVTVVAVFTSFFPVQAMQNVVNPVHEEQQSLGDKTTESTASGNAGKTSGLKGVIILASILGIGGALLFLLKKLKPKWFAGRTQRSEVARRHAALAEQKRWEAQGIIGDCPICMEPMKRGEEGVVRISCTCTVPFFHRECISQWFRQKSICPVCRQPARII